jgi:hypothetical protein
MVVAIVERRVVVLDSVDLPIFDGREHSNHIVHQFIDGKIHGRGKGGAVAGEGERARGSGRGRES